MNIIELKNLTKRFGDFTAVDNVSFTVRKGEIFGFLGPNGAGKTTTVSMLTTLKRRTSGTATVAGYDVEEERGHVRQSIGIVFQDPSLDEELTVYENLKFHAVMYGLDAQKIEKRISNLLKLVDLNDRKNKLASSLSGGMKRRLEIARGFMHYPKVLFLDEPTVGLDPQTRHHIWDYIEKLNQQEKVTVILTTHYMEEAEKLAHRIAVMDEGRIVALDTPEGLKKTIGGKTLTFHTSQPDEVSRMLKGSEGVASISKDNGTIQLSLKEGDDDVSPVLRTIIKAGCDVGSISVDRPTLEDVYIHLTGKRIRDDGASKKEANRAKSRGRR